MSFIFSNGTFRLVRSSKESEERIRMRMRLRLRAASKSKNKNKNKRNPQRLPINGGLQSGRKLAQPMLLLSSLSLPSPTMTASANHRAE